MEGEIKWYCRDRIYSREEASKSQKRFWASTKIKPTNSHQSCTKNDINEAEALQEQNMQKKTWWRDKTLQKQNLKQHESYSY